nr:glycosyltransferase [Lacticaseibacillus pantheris]
MSSNINVWRQLNRLMNDYQFDLIHCQSPLGGVFGRLVGRKHGVPVIYTAHGFHFYKGGPIKNWLIFYPIERMLSKFTDCIITINHDDDRIASSFHAKHHLYLPGVGVDVRRLNKVQHNTSLRSKYGIPQNAFVIVSCGELSERKNQQVIIRALASLNSSDIYYIIVGKGRLEKHLRLLVKENGLEKQVIFAGYHSDPTPFYAMADIAAFPSKREGLGLAGIEEMATGLPLLTTNIGGISDYSIDGLTGLVFDSDDYMGFASAIDCLKNDREKLLRISQFNRTQVNKFSQETVDTIMTHEYHRALNLV